MRRLRRPVPRKRHRRPLQPLSAPNPTPSAAATAKIIRGDHPQTESDRLLGLPFSALRKPTNLYSEGTRNVIVALKRASVRRLIVVSSFGVGDSRRDANLLERAFFSLALRGAYADKNLQEQAVRESGIDYTIVRPTRFTTSAGSGRYTAIVGPGPVPSPMARADVARFILDAVGTGEYVGKTVSLGRADKGR